MNYREHMLCGAGFFSIVYFLLEKILIITEIKKLLMYFFICLIGSVLPDIDHPKAHFTYKVPLFLITSSVIILGMKYYIYGSINTSLSAFSDIDKILYVMLSTGVFTFLFSIILFYTTGHRGITHSPFLYLVITLLFYIGSLFLKVDMIAVLFLMGGSISHIYTDGLSYRGIPLFFPFDRKYYHTAPRLLRQILHPGILIFLLAISLFVLFRVMKLYIL